MSEDSTRPNTGADTPVQAPTEVPETPEEQSNTKRQMIIVAILLGILALGGWGYGAFVAPKEKEAKAAPPKAIRTVETRTVTNQTLDTRLPVQGRLVPYARVDIFSEVNGIFEASSKPFKVGTYYPKGSLLLRIDSEETRLNLLAQRSNLFNAITSMIPDLRIDLPESFPEWEQYLRNYKVDSTTPAFPEPKSEQERYFVAARGIEAQYYTIKGLEERLSKFNIYAPMSGTLAEAAVNPGTLIRPGQKLGELTTVGTYELEATIPVSDLDYVKVGNPVELTNTAGSTWRGTIRRISDEVDVASQTVTVFVGVSGRGLKEGMYLSGDVATGSVDNALRINRRLLVDDNAVYVVEDSTLALQPVQVLQLLDTSAIIRGLPDGAELLSDRFSGAFEGMKVKAKKSGL